MIGASLLIAERQLDERTPGTLLRIRKLALPLTIVGTAFLCFDFSLSAEIHFHYMTNVGPAPASDEWRDTDGGYLFLAVRTWSVLITYLAFSTRPASLAVANIAINFVIFYSISCPHRCGTRRPKLAALWLGLIARRSGCPGGPIMVAGPMPTATSMEPLGIGRALSAVDVDGRRARHRRTNSRHSVLTFLASFLAAFWSAEAVAGVCPALRFPDADQLARSKLSQARG